MSKLRMVNPLYFIEFSVKRVEHLAPGEAQRFRVRATGDGQARALFEAWKDENCERFDGWPEMDQPRLTKIEVISQ